MLAPFHITRDVAHLMPEILRVDGYRFFFFSREGQEPPHIHVEQAERFAKFLLGPPVALAESRGFLSRELRDLHSLVEEHHAVFMLAWHEHFGQ